jgi:Domain of unknown function (DUF5063)
MERVLEEFFEAANAFCLWAESAPSTPNEEARTALRLVSRLYSLAFQLPDDFQQAETLAIPHEEWLVVYKRFGVLPFNYYNTVINVLDLEKADFCMGDIADDLADIWHDIKPGLSLYQSGHRNAAAYVWHEYFIVHWGQHAADAILALQSWQNQYRLSPDLNTIKNYAGRAREC